MQVNRYHLVLSDRFLLLRQNPKIITFLRLQPAKFELRSAIIWAFLENQSRMTTTPSNSAQSVSSSGSMGSPSSRTEQTTTVATTPASDDPASQLASGYVKFLYFPPLFFDLRFYRTYPFTLCVCVWIILLQSLNLFFPDM